MKRTHTFRLTGTPDRKTFTAVGSSHGTVVRVDRTAAATARAARQREQDGQPPRAESADALAMQRPALWQRSRTDELPHPTAFSVPILRLYPARTAQCRQCEELRMHSCTRGSCEKLGPTHAALLNAISDCACPLEKFSASEP